VWTQVLFFGALLSAILSTASGTLLAPSSLFTENVLKPLCGGLSDRKLLASVRVSLLVFASVATCIAVNSTSTMYEMVQNAYKVTLVGAFVPLAFGVYWKRSSTQGAVCAVVMGIGIWLLGEFYLPEGSDHPWAVATPQLMGLAASIVGMIGGSLAPQLIRERYLEGMSARVENMLEDASLPDQQGVSVVSAPAASAKTLSEVS
jgi:Na+/proline symporter